MHRTLCSIALLAAVSCGGAAESNTTPRADAAETDPAPEWNVTTGNATCDAHLKSTCRDAAVACLSNATCNALVACYRRCNESSPDNCAIDCERENRPDWSIVNPYISCASRERACDE